MKKYCFLCLKKLTSKYQRYYCHASAKQNNFKNNKGAVLIEFAFSIPILIIVLFFMLDVPMVYRISSKLQKTSELLAEMILNVNRKKKHKAVTKEDLENISKAIGITFTNVLENKNYPFYLSTYLICIKGNGGDRFEQKWSMHIQNDLVSGKITSNSDYKYSSLKEGSAKFLGNIEKFKIYKDEIKLIIETVIWYSDDTSRGFNNKFYLITIHGNKKDKAKTFGDKNAIITPPYWLITEKVPI